MTGPATTRGVTLTALMTALGRPDWWILALAGFLVRGGIVLFLLAIVSLPSPLAMSIALGPIITPLYLGQVLPEAIALIAAAVGAAVAWLVAGSWFAAATEVVLVRDARAAAIEDGLPVSAARGRGRLLITRSAAAHLLAHVPTLVGAALASTAIVDVLYRELVNPSSDAPLVPRVIGGATGPIGAVLALWLVGELVGGLAVRRVVRGEGLFAAVARAAGDVVRHPVSLLASLGTVLVLALDLAATLLVVTIVWTDMRDRLVQPLDDPLATGLGLATFVGAWGLALVVTGLIAAWRSAAMTYEAERVAARSAARLPSGAAIPDPV
jgi:hypothetical protein